MNTLRESTNIPSSPDMSQVAKPKTPLRKDELEKIAKQLKKKLSKASITAKQHLFTPKLPGVKSPTKFKPANLPHKSNLLSLSPHLYSPNKLPTKTKTAAMFLASSPLKPDDSPSKRLTLQQVTLPTPKTTALKPLPALSPSNKQTTPTLQKRQLHSATNPSQLLKTPTQLRQNSGNYNDDEGADLLMYLATSPSPAKPYFGTPRKEAPTSNPKPSQSSTFPPPLTPKRHINNGLARTPQNRLTPSVNLFNNKLTLPSLGLTLTPAGFNMSDYVFFTPSPGAAGQSVGHKNFLKTPDFNSIMNKNKHVDGKMINFDKVNFDESKET